MAVTLVQWLMRHIGGPTLLTLLLLLAALASVILGIADVIRGFNTDWVIVLAGLGLLLGWGLARLPIPAWLAAFMAASLGGELIFLHIGRLWGTAFKLVGVLFGLAWQAWRWPLHGPPNLEPGLQLGGQLGRGLVVLLSRLSTWLTGLAAGRATFDPITVMLVWSLAAWLVAVWAGWVVHRYRRPLVGLLPAGILLAATLTYAPAQYSPLLVLLGIALLLLGLMAYLDQKQQWQQHHLDYPEDIRLDITLTVLLMTIALVVMAGFIPTISLRSLARSARELLWGPMLEQTAPVGHSLGMEPQPGPATPLDEARRAGLPRQHLLGSGAELSEEVVMLIHIDDPAAEPPSRYYWRSLNYDVYTGFGWQSGPVERQAYRAGELAVTEYPATWRLVRQQVQVVGAADGLLYAAGQPLTVNQDFNIAWRGSHDIFGATVEAAPYQVGGLIPVADEAGLRAVPGDYPAWVANRYLRLPDSLPSRIRELAYDLTATAPTPYDRAIAIESYLRRFPYTLELPPRLPPAILWTTSFLTCSKAIATTTPPAWSSWPGPPDFRPGWRWATPPALTTPTATATSSPRPKPTPG